MPDLSGSLVNNVGDSHTMDGEGSAADCWCSVPLSYSILGSHCSTADLLIADTIPCYFYIQRSMGSNGIEASTGSIYRLLVTKSNAHIMYEAGDNEPGFLIINKYPLILGQKRDLAEGEVKSNNEAAMICASHSKRLCTLNTHPFTVSSHPPESHTSSITMCHMHFIFSDANTVLGSLSIPGSTSPTSPA